MALSTGDSVGHVPDISLPAGGIRRFFASHPIGFWFIFWGEFAERASYYGMRGILSIYMADQLGFGERSASFYMHVFIFGCYVLPLLGGYLADNFFGKYNIIVGFSIPYILGHVILGIESPLYLTIALILLAMGSGVIKPNISTLMGLTYDQYRPGQEQLRSTAFSMFYISINIGAFLSQIAIPWIRTNYGYQIAFLFPAMLMVFAFVFFASGKKFYAREVIVRTQKTPEERALQWQVLGRIGGLFLLVMFFWAIFDQSTTTWLFFARTYMNLEMFGYRIDPEQVQALNPILIVALTPGIAYLWTVLDRRGIKVRATDKMVVGFLLTAVCMAVMAYAGFRAGPGEGEKVTVAWQMLAYLALTVAEILISVTGLELAFVAAPKNMKSFVTGMWLASVGLANLFLNVPVTQLYSIMNPGIYFAMLAAALVAVALAFIFVAKRFNRLVEMEKAVEEEQGPEFPPVSPTSENIQTPRDQIKRNI